MWERAIALVDMNAFFASIEQADFPELQGQAVAVTNGDRGTTIITCSYEARAYGIKTGMRMKEALQLCPALIQRPSRSNRYAEISTVIMHSLNDITPDVEVFSVDEAFLDLTHVQGLWGEPADIAQLVKDKVKRVSGLNCSIGVSGDKTTAKWAAKQNKPDGLTVVTPWEAEAVLANEPVTALCGVAKGIGGYLNERGVFVCGDMKNIPISALSSRFGTLGRRIWLMAQAKDPSPVTTEVAAPKSVGHGKVMPPNTTENEVVITYLLHMSVKVAARLRRHGMVASQFFFGLKCHDENIGWIKTKISNGVATDDGNQIYRLGAGFFDFAWDGRPVFQIQVTALDPRQAGQLTLLNSNEHEALNSVVDDVNDRYGELAISPARIQSRSGMPNVIAPGWRPSGIRKTV